MNLHNSFLILFLSFISQWNFLFFFVSAEMKCPSCPPNLLSVIRGFVHRAIYLEPRHVYYSYYADWMDELVVPENPVNIQFVKPSELESYVPTGVRVDDISNVETFEVIFSYFGLPTMDELEYMSPDSASLDVFLTHNPCWIPLLEPCAFNCSHKRGNYSREISELVNYQNSVILLRLPSNGFKPTCIFYEALVKRQFPEKCNYDTDHMMSFEVHNIGWSHTLHTLGQVMMNTLMEGHTEKVFVTARAEPFGGENQIFKLVNGTEYERDRSKWYWASSSCPQDNSLFDPWACNFLSFSNCSTRKTVFDIPPQTTNRFWNVDYTFYQKRLGISTEMRKIFNDAPSSDDSLWLNQRLFGFLTRSHARLRQLIRRSLYHVRPLFDDAHVNHDQPVMDAGGHLRARKTAPRGHEEIVQHGQRPHFYYSQHSRKSNLLRLPGPPCIAMHVRHGDSRFDGRSHDNTTDRSFFAHVNELKKVSTQLGTNVVFLMTDNTTLREFAPKMFPEFNWLMQRRPIIEQTGMYRVDNEDDIQVELAHVLADLIFGGRCIALVACFDSGIADQVRRYMGDQRKIAKPYYPYNAEVLHNILKGWTKAER